MQTKWVGWLGAPQARTWAWIAKGLFGAALVVACGGRAESNGGTSSETNWLARCASDSDCDEGSCLCGACTVSCQSDNDCSDVSSDAECLSVASLGCSDTKPKAICGEEDTPFESTAIDGGTQKGRPSTDGTDAAVDKEETTDDEAAPSSDEDSTTDDPPGREVMGTPEQDAGAKPGIDREPQIMVPGEATEDSANSMLDLLLVVDNSRNMADKQQVFAEAVPQLVNRLTSTGFVTVNVGVITTSLGGYGAASDCSDTGQTNGEQNVDMAHLLGRPARAGIADFLSWNNGSGNEQSVSSAFADQVTGAGEYGCGWEASLEAWYRFLIEPYPYTKIVRRPCNAADTNNLCSGPETDPEGNQLVDKILLNQREQFLRPGSTVAVVMLTDENDCSFVANGQSWRLAQTVNDDGGFNVAFRAASACSDPAYGPNHECCVSCGLATAPNGCPTAINENGDAVSAGCESERRYASDGTQDHPNLRCFHQKERFGVDHLYPVERYVNALRYSKLCPFAPDLDPRDDASCPDGAGVVNNPLYDTREVDGMPLGPRRTGGNVFVTGLVGVPWQDVAISADPADPLVLRSADPSAPADERLTWDWLIGIDPLSSTPTPTDPLMVESITPRQGVNPATGEATAPSTSGFGANSINGHEWVTNNEDLQYACTAALTQPRECPSPEEYRALADAGQEPPSCECTDYGDDARANPLCQAPNGEYGAQQQRFKAYPSIRQLQVMSTWGPNAVVGSICTKDEADPDSEDYGYRPFVNALAERLMSARQ